MTTITTSFKTSSGKNVTLNLTVENYKVIGNATIDGQDYVVNGYAVVQGRQVLKLTSAPAPYLPIASALYNQIEAACKSQFISQMTPLEIAEGKMREAEVEYHKLADRGDNIATIKAMDEWNRLSAEYHRLLAE